MKLKYFLFVITLIVLDQTVKSIVHFNMPLHSEISIIGEFFKLHHLENPGKRATIVYIEGEVPTPLIICVG